VSTQEPQNSAKISLEELIKGFLRHNDFLHEFRLQKLIYLAELISLKENQERLSNANFKPYMYGAYSDDINDALEELEPELDTSSDLQHGKITTVYKGSKDEADLPKEIDKIIQRISETVNSNKIPNEELGSWSKETWLYENTPFGEPMDFSDYWSLSGNRLSEDIQKKFPELIEDS